MLSTRDIDARVANLMLELGRRIAISIKATREAKKLSQKQLADMLATGQSRVSQLEDATYTKYTLSSLARVAAVLDCDLVIELRSRLPVENSAWVPNMDFIDEFPEWTSIGVVSTEPTAPDSSSSSRDDGPDISA